MFELHPKTVDGPLSVVSTPYGNEVIVVALAGELDRANVLSAAKAIDSALSADGKIVVVDLQELEFLDSSGVAMLAELTEPERSNGRLRIVPSRSLGVARILAATGMNVRLKMVQDGVPSVVAS